MSIRILLADDHRIMREGLRALLAEQPGMEVIGEAADGRTAAQLVQQLSPDVVIMDISMPDLNGIEATRQITAKLTDVKIIALSVHSNNRFVAEMLKAGAAGYLLKDCALEELAGAIRTVVTNRIYLGPGIADVVVEDYMRHLSATESPTESAPFSVLSARQREVLQLLAEGKTTKQIASSLYVSVKTIETHRRQIMRKLDIHSIAELTKYAIREGLTSLES